MKIAAVREAAEHGDGGGINFYGEPGFWASMAPAQKLDRKWWLLGKAQSIGEKNEMNLISPTHPEKDY